MEYKYGETVEFDGKQAEVVDIDHKRNRVMLELE